MTGTQGFQWSYALNFPSRSRFVSQRMSSVLRSGMCVHPLAVHKGLFTTRYLHVANQSAQQGFSTLVASVKAYGVNKRLNH